MKQKVTKETFDLIVALSVSKRLKADARPIDQIGAYPVFDLVNDIESYDVTEELLTRYEIIEDANETHES